MFELREVRVLCSSFEYSRDTKSSIFDWAMEQKAHRPRGAGPRSNLKTVGPEY